MYTRLTDEIRHANETMRDKRKSLMQREAEIIGSMGNAANGEELHTDDGRVLILTQKNKRPSLAKKEFFSRGLETFWNRLTSAEHESMSGSVFAARQLAFLKDLQDAVEVSRRRVALRRERNGNDRRQRRMVLHFYNWFSKPRSESPDERAHVVTHTRLPVTTHSPVPSN
jgi:hypothetical protein